MTWESRPVPQPVSSTRAPSVTSSRSTRDSRPLDSSARNAWKSQSDPLSYSAAVRSYFVWNSASDGSSVVGCTRLGIPSMTVNSWPSVQRRDPSPGSNAARHAGQRKTSSAAGSISVLTAHRTDALAESGLDDVERPVLHLLEDLSDVQAGNAHADDRKSAEYEHEDGEAGPAGRRVDEDGQDHEPDREHDSRRRHREAQVDDPAQERGRLEEDALRCEAHERSGRVPAVAGEALPVLVLDLASPEAQPEEHRQVVAVLVRDPQERSPNACREDAEGAVVAADLHAEKETD